MTLRQVISIVVLVTSSICVNSFNVTAASWVNKKIISRLEVVGNYSWVMLEGHAKYCGQNSVYGYKVNNANKGYEYLFRALLTAHLASQPVQLEIEHDSGTGADEQCRVTRVRFGE